jgi:uncharacterized protein (DUF58 family)
MKRYTVALLRDVVYSLNLKLAERGHAFRFVIGGRHNRTAIDLATPEQMAAHCRHEMLESGTPRKCADACFRYVATHV